jgi:hypothetical protein
LQIGHIGSTSANRHVRRIVRYNPRVTLSTAGASACVFAAQFRVHAVSQGQVNELLPTLALQLQIPGNTFRPYVVLGGGHENFHFAAPVVPGTHNLKFWTGHTGVGFRLKLANWAALRTEANAQVSGHRPSWGAFTGVSFYPGARKSAPMVVAATPVVQHDTIAVRMVDTLVKVDTLRVNTRMQVTTSDTVTRTVEGRDVILVLRDANFDMKLGMARATSVQKYLAAKGVDASRMAVDSRGEADPIASNATADGRQQNRRVVIGKQQR